MYDIKDFIRLYVLLDNTPNENGISSFFFKSFDNFMLQWETNGEFTSINDPFVGRGAYGIKYWILER